MASDGFIEELKKVVQDHFEQIRESINVREKLLLRQIDVIKSQSTSNASILQEINFVPEGKDDLLSSIRGFGKLNLDSLNFATDMYANEDYILPSVDHETMYKCLQQVKDGSGTMNGNDDEEVVLDFSSNKKLIRENVNNINESIINITLNEAKELIRKAKPLQSLKLGKELISQSSQTEKKNQTLKANITINNCNGTINLKNISNLTINCTKEDSLNVEENTKESANNSDETNDHYEEQSGTSLRTSSTKDNENNSVNCEFYNRLITEIKNSLKQGYKTNDTIPGNNSDSTTTTTTSDSYNRKFLLKNFENLKIVLESNENENEARPIQIEQWLAEIISETEVEPMQNPEFLEHSKIHTKEMY